ncbi:unnamed protein product (macronuclear) [Paramecium tetraurelia]|uniref:Mitochondrial import inner membrane translocase subunit TIM50 n=1 Tax=Paramecium tetraurelia TaxID=5888 RepID=A0E936_PARTE|nr:uncharacterized protein GSPATT00024534001 [Paramecium tetraurelia]CAK91803.1 unnamed protein product [Paramecium tetraurelia]|eukprot:XP_001459200.1 hypothetical protein (macronuclear) [Paramecium tetraurelia strain d4-2]
MDKLISFKAKSHVGHLKQVITQEQKLQFYSEEEGESSNSQDNTPTPDNKGINKPNPKQNGFQTDDSEGGTPKSQRNTQQQHTTKMSRFSNLVNTKRIDGDVENEPDFSDTENNRGPVEQGNQEANYNIEEQAQRIQQKLSLKAQANPKLAKAKQTSSMQNLNTNSDQEQNKKNPQLNQNNKIAQHPFRHLIFGQYINEQAFKKHLLLTQRGLIYARKCLKGPSDKFIESKKVYLNEITPKKEKTLILDLDETLIHSCTPRENPQVYVTAIGDFGEEAKIGINIRPYTSLFLSSLSQFYTIYIYTASSQAYAQAIIGYLDPKKQYISGVLSRNNCMETKNGFFIKDLRLIGNKQLKDMLIIDNLAHSFGFQIENGIPIMEWHNDQNDQELKALIDYLKEAVNYPDIREYNTNYLKLDELMEFNLDE